MSLSVAGVWAVGVWDQTVWEDGVWREGERDVDEDVSVTKGGSAEGRAKRKKVHEARRLARLSALKKADDLFESIFGKEEDPKIQTGDAAVKVTGLPKMPVFDQLRDIATIKDKVVRKIAEFVRIDEIKAHNVKVRKYEQGIRRLEEELVAVLVLTADENIGVINLEQELDRSK